jgi:hypothetical protein
MSPMPEIERSVSVRHVAELLDHDESTVRKMAHRGLLDWHRSGCGTRGMRIFLSSVERYRSARMGLSNAPHHVVPVSRPTKKEGIFAAPASCPTKRESNFAEAVTNAKALGII